MPAPDGIQMIPPPEEFEEMLGAIDKVCRGSLVGELHRIGWTIDGVTEEDCHRRGTHVSARSHRLHTSQNPLSRRHSMSDTFASRPAHSFKKAYRTPDLSEQHFDRWSPREAWFQHRGGERSPLLNHERDEFYTLPEFHNEFWQAAAGKSPAPSPRKQPVARQRSAPASWRSSINSESTEAIDQLPMPSTVIDACWRQNLRHFSASDVDRPMPGPTLVWTPTPQTNAVSILQPEETTKDTAGKKVESRPFAEFETLENLLTQDFLPRFETVRKHQPAFASAYVTPRDPGSGKELANHIEAERYAHDVEELLLELGGTDESRRRSFPVDSPSMQSRTSVETPRSFRMASTRSRNSASSPGLHRSTGRSSLKVQNSKLPQASSWTSPPSSSRSVKRQTSQNSGKGVTRLRSTETRASAASTDTGPASTASFTPRSTPRMGARGAALDFCFGASPPSSPRFLRNVGASASLRESAAECQKQHQEKQLVPSDSPVLLETIPVLEEQPNAEIKQLKVPDCKKGWSVSSISLLNSSNDALDYSNNAINLSEPQEEPAPKVSICVSNTPSCRRLKCSSSQQLPSSLQNSQATLRKTSQVSLQKSSQTSIQTCPGDLNRDLYFQQQQIIYGGSITKLSETLPQVSKLPPEAHLHQYPLLQKLPRQAAPQAIQLTQSQHQAQPQMVHGHQIWVRR